MREVTGPQQSVLGREAELATLEQLLDAAEDGSARFAAISGEAGIGKTTLLAEATARAEARGWLALGGRSSELERELPFGLMIDAFDAYLGSLEPATFQRLTPDELTELAGLFPSLRSLAPAPAEPGTPAERHRAHHAVAELAERLATRQALLLVLDDMHWADAASIEQVGYLLRRPPSAAVVVLIGFRAGQASRELAVVLEAADRERAIETMELGPLSGEAARALVGPDLPASTLERGGGNPFYLLQLARAGSDGGPEATSATVPAGIVAAIVGELASLPPAAREFAEAAAVAGDPFELDLALAAGGIDEEAGLAALDELVARDLIRSGETPRTFQFRHPLVRSAIYESCPPGVRLAAHRRAAEELAARGEGAAVRAHHVEHAARPGDAEAGRVLREAGEESLGRAPASAARWLGAALRVLPPDDEQRFALEVSLARALAATGDFTGVRDALERAIALAPGDQPAARVRLIGQCAAIEQLLGLRERSHQRLIDALNEESASGSPLAASLMIDLLVDAFNSLDYAATVDWGRRAVAAADEGADRPLRAAALAAHAWGAAGAGAVEEAVGSADAAAELVDAMPDAELAQRLDAVAHLAGAEFLLCRYKANEEHARRGLALARATGQDGLFPILAQGLANNLFTTGRLREASELLASSADAARTSNNVLGLWWMVLAHGLLEVTIGDFDAAHRYCAEGMELSRQLREPAIERWAAAISGALALEEGDSATAATLLADAVGDPERSLVPASWRASWLERLVRARLGAGDRAGAAQAAEDARAASEGSGLPLDSVSADRAEADIALDAGDPQRAARLAQASAQRAEELTTWIDAAFARELAGRALAEAGDKEGAGNELTRAAELFDRCGALRYRDRTERELRRLGRSIHRRTARGEGEGVAALSGRELEVARLVVDRKTNPQIAAELFLSVKTVESHLRNIFRKLGVDSRVDVARVVERDLGDAANPD